MPKFVPQCTAMSFRHAPPWQNKKEDQSPAMLNGMSFKGQHKYMAALLVTGHPQH